VGAVSCFSPKAITEDAKMMAEAPRIQCFLIIPLSVYAILLHFVVFPHRKATVP